MEVFFLKLLENRSGGFDVVFWMNEMCHMDEVTGKGDLRSYFTNWMAFPEAL